MLSARGLYDQFCVCKTQLGCLMEKGVNEITHSKAFAQGVGCSRCSGDTTQLLLLIC